MAPISLAQSHSALFFLATFIRGVITHGAGCVLRLIHNAPDTYCAWSNTALGCCLRSSLPASTFLREAHTGRIAAVVWLGRRAFDTGFGTSVGAH